MRRVMALMIAMVLTLSGLLSSVSVTSADTGSTGKERLADGNYAVPLVITKGDPAVATGNITGGTTDKYRTALLSVADGRYTVTIRVASVLDGSGVQNKGIKILKEEYEASDIGDPATGGLKGSFDKEEYWRGDVAIEIDEQYGCADLTFTVENTEQPVIMALSNPYYGQNYNQITLAYESAERLPDEIADGSYEWSYRVDNTFRFTSNTQQSPDTAIAEKMMDLIDTEVTVDVQDGAATATFVLTDAGRELGQLWYVNGYKYSNKREYYLIARDAANYTQAAVGDDGTFQMTYDLSNYKDMVFGKVIKMLGETGSKTYYYFGTLRLSTSEPVRSVTLTDEGTGIEYVTNTVNISDPDSVTLKATKIEPDNQEFSIFISMFEGVERKYTIWDIEVVNKDTGTPVTLTQTGQLRIPVPEGYETARLQGYVYHRGQGAVEKGTIEDGYVVIDGATMNAYAVAEHYNFESTAEDMKDGSYTVEYVIQKSSSDVSSMADNAMIKPAKLVVKDGRVYLHLELQSILVGGLEGRLTGLWLEGEDKALSPAMVYQYLQDGDGLRADKWQAGRTNYWVNSPEKLYLQLPPDQSEFLLKVRIPAMDGLNGINGYIGKADANCWLRIDYSTAVPLADEEQIPGATVRDALAAAIEAANSMKEEEAAGGWDDVQTAIAAAVTVLESGTEDEMQGAYNALQTAVGNVEYVSAINMDKGIHTAEGSVEGASDVRVTDARVLVNSDASANLFLTFSGADNLQYYDIHNRAYVDMTAEETADGQKRYRVDFDAITAYGGEDVAVYDSLTIRYTDGSGAEQTHRLNLTDFTLQDAVSKEELTARLAEANQKIEEETQTPGTYDGDAMEVLKSAVAAAMLVQADIAALQTEVDARVTALSEAIDGLAGEGSREELQKLLIQAQTEYAKEDVYTLSSREELKGIMDEAQALLEGKPTAAQLGAMVLKLDTFLREGLAAQADKTKLQDLCARAEAIENDNYSGWDNLQEIIQEAKELLENKDATQTQVDDMAAFLTAAISSLEDSVDKDALSNLVSQAEELLATGQYQNCTQESLDFLNAAITAAKAVLNDPAASQNDVNKHRQMLLDADSVMVKKPEEGRLYDGVYQVPLTILKETAESDEDTSMANAAVKSAEVIVENGVPARIRLGFKSLKINSLNGYLGWLKYFPGYFGTGSPTGQTASDAAVESWQTNEDGSYVTDEYTDTYMNGDPYPEYLSIPVQQNENGGYYTEYWLQVYVPVMAYINKPSGTQYARLKLNIEDWAADMTQTSGTENAEKTALQEQIRTLTDLKSSLSTEDYLPEDLSLLDVAIAAGNAFDSNLNIGQELVDKMVTALQTTAKIFEQQTVESNKTELEAAIAKAHEELAREDVVYTEISREHLQWVISAAEVVYDNQEATQEQVSRWTALVNEAIGSLTVDESTAVKEELGKVLENARERLGDTGNYTGAALDVLKSLYDRASEVYEKSGVSQEEVDRQTGLLTYYLANMEKVTAVAVEKQGLYAMLLTASSLAGREHQYTAESIEALRTAVRNAESVYSDEDATQQKVNEQVSKLYNAMLALEAKPADTNSGNNNNNNNNNGDNDSNNDNNQNLDINNLKDGVYSLSGSMVKVDQKTESMSNQAVNHTVKLTVKDGNYFITLDFKGLEYSGQYGYLRDLQYFKTGYTLNQYGVPKGTLADVTIESYQKTSDGTLVSDSYGTEYPDVVTFPLIPEALKDGYVPLQVFVPVMESIAAGTGTQPVFLKLDWSTLKSTTADDPDFTDDGGDDGDNDGGNDDNNSGNGSGLGTSSLKSSGSSNLSGSSGLKSSGTSGLGTTSTSGLKAGSVKTGDDSPVGALLFLMLTALGAGAVAIGAKRGERKGRKAERK
ncbi:NEAT domain-containing protein [Ruminococcus sp. OA3]|uniref:NEAT domain-containing protein n=1 Tax=Ruminococcus sp. OA3 TaxID=2914164 RepID=UPI001F0598F2|nr:NEAT domain-containing protein [Ruminococcus sp. OA3]MCH1981394.1 NEAT domain-containing protein [Ruminococcus sp. OA3]